MDQLVRAIAVALDIVEGQLLGASTHHGKRIAVLSVAMGRCFGLKEENLSSLATCALFHDSALTEYIISEQRAADPAMRLHCEYGQRNAEALLTDRDVSGFVLYHHERADGLGPFGKKEGSFPLGAEIIAIADMLDVAHHLQTVSAEDLPRIRKRVTEGAGTIFTRRAAEAMLSVLDEKMLAGLRDERIAATVENVIPVWLADVEHVSAFRIAGLAARIIDYKSVFTKRHSVQIANKAWLMGGHYNMDGNLRACLYMAAALHDLGKLATPSHILEKPGRLTPEEFDLIKDHARLTEDILKDVSGFEYICAMAAGHHERLDGTGYHQGKNADDLDFTTRLLACLDIYQAVSETRPYHAGRSHAETMPILYDMAENGWIDQEIVRDLAAVMAEYSNRDVPPPPEAALLGNV
jgi:HD-GYP domain-containing protein (c-di-GMP phosphodiesterase class II)